MYRSVFPPLRSRRWCFPTIKSKHPKLFLAMTGLTHAEFNQLLPHFQYAWDQYVTQYYIDRGDRQRQYGAGRSEETLVHREDKLLFILYYVKVYPCKKSSPLSLVWCKVQQMSGFTYWARY